MKATIKHTYDPFTDSPSAPIIDDPEATYCRNAKRGCNGVTDGRDARGNLTLCDDCEREQSPSAPIVQIDPNRRRYRLMSPDGTFACYNMSTGPFLTANEFLAYQWESPEAAEHQRRLYETALGCAMTVVEVKP